MLATALPMLEEMSNRMKKIQQVFMYIAEYNTMCKLACVTLDNLYRNLASFWVDDFFRVDQNHRFGYS